MNYPRLLNSTGAFSRSLYPITESITLNATPLSTASITLPKGEYLPTRGFVELFTPYGSAGVFRVRSPRDAYGAETTTAELESAISEVGDFLVKDSIDKMMPADDAIKTLFAHYKGTHWKLGSITAAGKGKVAVQADYVRVLDAILSVIDQVPSCMLSFDFSTFPWTVSVVAKGKTVAAEGRLERNVNFARITYDDTDLCTRAYYQTYKENSSGETVGTWTYKNADTVTKYGVVEKKLSTSSDMTASEIATIVDTYLAEHKEPRLSVEINAEELTAITGESMDKFTLGKLFRLVIPEYNVALEQHITEISWDNLYTDPMRMTVKLGKPEDTVVTFLHDLDTSGSTSSSSGGGGGGGGGGGSSASKWKEYQTKFDKTDEKIALVAIHQNKDSEILQAAGLDITADGALIYATDNENNIGSRLNVTSEAITAEVKRAKKQEGELSGRLTITSEAITAEVKRAKKQEGELSGRLTITSNEIEQEVTNRKSADKTLSGQIKVNADKVSIVVEEKNGENVVKTASIVTAINESGSSIKLDADKVYIGNTKSTTIINGKLDASAVTADYIQGKIADLSVLNVKAISSSGNISVSNGYMMAPYIYLGVSGNAKNLAGAIQALQIQQDGDSYKLRKKDFDDADWVDVGTFSRATTLSGTWSGSTSSGKYYTVTASPQGATKSSNSVTAITSGSKSWASDNKSFTITIKAVAGGTTDLYSKSVEFDTTTSYNAGVSYAKPVSWTSGSQGSLSQFTAKATSTGGGSATKTYYLVKNGSYVEVHEGLQTGTRVARIAV